LAVSIDHSYWLALACVAFEWKPVLRNVFARVILLRLLRFLRTFLTIALRALRALRLDGNRALGLDTNNNRAITAFEVTTHGVIEMSILIIVIIIIITN